MNFETFIYDRLKESQSGLAKGIPTRSYRGGGIAGRESSGGLSQRVVSRVQKMVPVIWLRDAASPVTYDHPWKIFTVTDEAGDCLAYVYRGAVTVHDWHVVSSAIKPFTNEREKGLYSGTPSASTPLGPMVSETATIGGTAGYFVLPAPVSNTKTYGIWLVCYPVQSSGAVTGATANWIKFEPYGLFVSEHNVVATAASYATYDVGAGDGEGEYAHLMVFFIGSVSVDPDGIGTISQWRKSDVHTHAPLWIIPDLDDVRTTE